MDSKIGLLIQLNGVFLITILSLFLRRSLKLTALKYWTIAWLCLSFALISLRLAFDFQQLGTLLFTYYFLGEYIFCFMLIAGCRSLDTDREIKARYELLIVPFVAIAIILPLLASDFNDLFPLHSLILAGFYAVAFAALSRLELRSFGWYVMHISLVLLTLDYGSYFALSLARDVVPLAPEILMYNSIVNMILQTSIGFGMVIVLLERVLSDVRSANAKLAEAHRRLEELVHTDPLTAAFNRHAFYGFVQKGNEDGKKVSGCVGFFDIDGLKHINDCFGHAAGDSAIRVVVRAIRELIRAEDLIFRWGGDEFFVIMVSMDAELAEVRMSRLESALRNVPLTGVSDPVDIGISWGFTDFSDANELERAINEADAEMYRRKRGRKTQSIDPAHYGGPVSEGISTIGVQR